MPRRPRWSRWSRSDKVAAVGVALLVLVVLAAFVWFGLDVSPPTGSTTHVTSTSSVRR
jgi:hypothetical protein